MATITWVEPGQVIDDVEGPAQIVESRRVEKTDHGQVELHDRAVYRWRHDKHAPPGWHGRATATATP